MFSCYFVPSLLSSSVLWHCWLGVSKSTRPVKIEWWGAGVVIWLKQSASDMHMVQLMPLMSLASLKSRTVYLSGAGLTRLSWKRAVKWLLLFCRCSESIWCLRQTNGGRKRSVTHPGTPACLLCDPADLSLTDSAHDPVAAVLLDDDHLTSRTLHRVAELQQLLQICAHIAWFADPSSLRKRDSHRQCGPLYRPLWASKVKPN